MDERQGDREPEARTKEPRGVFKTNAWRPGGSGGGVFGRPEPRVMTEGAGEDGGAREQAKLKPRTETRLLTGTRLGTREKARRPFIVRMTMGLWSMILTLLIIAAGTLAGVALFDKVLMPRVVLLGKDVVIPALAGLELTEAEELLTAVGLQPARAAGRHHPAVPGGRVLDVSPPAGMSVKAGRQVFLIPSLGGLDHKVPDVVGLSLRMAEMNLSASGLRVREIREAATQASPPGHVLAMSPQSGTDAPATSDVALLVSRLRAPTPFTMPDLRGRDGADATAWLRSRGFRVEQSRSDGAGRPGSVLDQNPRVGEPIWPGSEVRLTMSRSSQDRGARRLRL